MTSIHDPLSLQVRGGVGTITMDRPGKHNAMTVEMWSRIPELIDECAAATDVDCIVIRGAHGSFSAGADLNEVLLATSSTSEAEHFCRTVVTALLAIGRSDVPTIAQLSGIASGGGAEIALACDLRIADDSARLQLPLAGLGVVPDDFTLHRLVGLVGSSTSRYMLMTGQALDASTCLRSGLVHQVVPATELADTVEQVAASVRSKSRYAMRNIKDQLVARELALAVQEMTAPMVASFVHGDVAASASAFLGERAVRRKNQATSDHQENS